MERNDTEKQYAYIVHIVADYDELRTRLNEMGSKGFRLVNVMYSHMNTACDLIFEREIVKKEN